MRSLFVVLEMGIFNKFRRSQAGPKKCKTIVNKIDNFINNLNDLINFIHKESFPVRKYLKCYIIKKYFTIMPLK